MSYMPPPKIATISDRCCGRAHYTADLIPPETAVTGLARSPHAHARVVRINTEKAMNIPGVLGVLTSEDFADITLGHHIADEPVLASHVRYVGEGVAAVAAINDAALIAGIAALEIDYEILPHAIRVDDALALEVPLHEACPDNVADRFSANPGDWHDAAARATHWVEGIFETAAVPHAYLEPRACFVRVSGDHLELVSASHAPSVLASRYSEIAKHWGATVDVVTPDMGGSFGAKWEHPTHLVCLAFAHKLQRDVALVLSHRDDMMAGRTRLATRLKMRIGATSDGELVAKETEVWADNGAYTLHGPPVMLASAVRGDNLYKYAAVRARGQLIYTNNMPTECFRGFGIPQSTFAQEQLVDELARKIGLDPAHMRRRNTVGAGDTSIHGWEISSCGYGDCLDTVEEQMQAHRNQERSGSGDRFKYGYGLSTAIHCVSNSGYDETSDISNVTIDVNADGMICVASGEVELGCGTAEVLRHTVERELGVTRDS
ncbi:MAG: xanthine dehydrogenase family protein, partial [Rhodospirillales bacterium]|nr:xanthine dehydrogenase family protein [Rhodospirillales bacterium]